MRDAELKRRFEDRTLPFAEWTHRAHVRMAFTYLSEGSFDRALSRLREGIRAYNAAHGVPDGPLEGYHETTTHAFLRIIDTTMRVHSSERPPPDSEAFCDEHPHLLSKFLLRLYYSPARRRDPRGKREFVEPDLAPLPRVPDEGGARGGA